MTPSVGRFISEDPIGFEGGDVNLYAYVRNNPVNLVDPKGLWGRDEHGEKFIGLDSGWTMPYNPFSMHLHFWIDAKDRAEIESKIVAAAKAGDYAAFKDLVHSGEDSFNPAHSSVIKHIFLSLTGQAPDSALTYPNEFKAKQEWTKAQEAVWSQARSNSSGSGGGNRGK